VTVPDRNADPRATTASLISACWSTQVIHAAVRLGIPELLAQGPASSREIAARIGIEARPVFRLLRALAVLGQCEHVGGDRFELTPAGQYLRKDVPGSLHVVALHWGGRTWSAFTHLERAVRTGAAWNHAGREGFYSMAERPDEASVLNRSMAQQTLAVARTIVEAYDFSRFRSVIDLGGGYGALLSVVLQAHPQLEGASADLAYLESEAQSFLRDAGVADRARFIPTDFFASVASGADGYLLKFIIHDWNDADAIQILRNTRAAAGPDGVVLVIEQIAPEHVECDPQQALVIRGDIHMLAATGGMERTAAEYRALLAQAGLELARIVPTASSFSIIEAVPARAET